MITKDVLYSKVKQITLQANVSLRKDILRLLKKSYADERNKKAKYFLGLVVENALIAHKKLLPICQDTGLPVVFLEAGRDVRLTKELIDAVKKGVRDSYRDFPLRASFVWPLKRGFPFHGEPLLHLEFGRGRGLKITVLPKGFGSENKSRLKMFSPTADWQEIEDFIVEVVKGAGPDACPPFVVGVGVGGTSDYALLLAKKALLERLDRPSKHKSFQILEKRLWNRLNSLNIGVMGLGGRHTVLAVRIKTHPTHIAGLPVGVNVSCHALRSATLHLK